MPPRRAGSAAPAQPQRPDDIVEREEEDISPDTVQADPPEIPEETVAEAILRLEGEKEALREQDKLRQLQLEVQQMKRTRDRLDAATAPSPPSPLRIPDALSRTSGFDESASMLSAGAPHSQRGSRPKMKDPKPFTGDSIKEAREFLRALKIIFANSGPEYSDDRSKVLYGVMWLAADAAEAWHNQYDIEALPDEYGWEDFQSFVRNAVGDPANRQLSVTLEYEKVRQGDHQTVKSFALELDVLESQLDYTETQLVRQFLAKLKPSLRMDIVKNHELPSTRADMVSLARRLEAADRGATATLAGNKRFAGEAPTGPSSSYGRSNKRPRGGRGYYNSSRSGRESDGRSQSQSQGRRDETGAHAPRSQPDGAPRWNPKCFACGEMGHIQPNCPRRNGGKAAVTKVDASASKKASAPERKLDL